MTDRTTQRVIESLYVAWFNRWAETTTGMDYWLTNWTDAITVSDGFWAATSPTYPGLNIAPWNSYQSNSTSDLTAFVQLVYWYVMGRSVYPAPSPTITGITSYNGLLTSAEVSYWLGQMQSPYNLSHGAVMIAIINGMAQTDMSMIQWTQSPYSYNSTQIAQIRDNQIAFENKVQVGLLAYAAGLNPANPGTACVFGGSTTPNVDNTMSSVNTCLSTIGVSVGSTKKFLILGQSNPANFGTTNGLTYNTSTSVYAPPVTITSVATTDAWYAASSYVTYWDQDAQQERMYSDLLAPGAGNNRTFVTDSFGTANPYGASVWASLRTW